MLDGGGYRRLVKTPKLAIRRHPCTNIEVAFGYVGSGGKWEQSGVLCHVGWEAVLLERT